MTTATTRKEKLLLTFRDRDAVHAVSRRTVKKIAKLLGLNETETALLALARLRDQLIPAYKPDDGPVPDRVLEAISKIVPQGDFRPTRTLFGA